MDTVFDASNSPKFAAYKKLAKFPKTPTCPKPYMPAYMPNPLHAKTPYMPKPLHASCGSKHVQGMLQVRVQVRVQVQVQVSLRFQVRAMAVGATVMSI